MEFSKKRIEALMDQYLQDNEDFGDYTENTLISEVFNKFNSLILENTSNKVSDNLLKEHASSLDGVPKDIFEDFILYVNMTELDSRLL